MITLREYKIGDWKKIKDAVEPFTFIGGLDDIALRGIAVTALNNNKVMACGGVTFFNEHEGAVWVKISKDCAKRPFMWARTIKETFVLMIESVDNMKISTYILDGFCKGEKLAKLIGLKRTDETEKYKENIYNKYTAMI